jgi:formylglycine-generating enzyme
VAVPRSGTWRAPSAADSFDPWQPGTPIARRVLKGGSHVCAPNYCLRYRLAARQPEAVDTSGQHIGFRCVVMP